MLIDTTLDFRTESPDRDPDTFSPTLRANHRLLWSKPLPNGDRFDLDILTQGVYLHHESKRGEFFLSSDTITATFIRWEAFRPIASQFSEESNRAFQTLAYTIGGMIIWPGNRIDGRMTINGARGFLHKISDRFDLTLECVRRHYLGTPNPLGEVFARYGNFFALFDDFCGYVDFFLLQDLVTTYYKAVKFVLPFDDFKTPAVPQDVESFASYRQRSMDFIHARNRRIVRWTDRLTSGVRP